MSGDELGTPGEGELGVRFVLDVVGGPEQVDKVAQDLTRACERAGVRFVVERQRPPAPELGLYAGEHRL